ncbi:AI-2E family transporter [Roseivirga seohaensis]|mgnify:CR=1 FL=1|uniref:AI-2E family transporter n=1 Tax=Roseivirga seohaensis TaxID=1914963 RepID=UPI0008F692D3|nr:AI-2E family transporter [Roseivirga seohaensis]|tara:strand:+ start:3314 stop:4450 length:1137 start_codon:yes stop_codon:yes gene_type:complete
MQDSPLKDLRTTNTLLLIIVIPLVFYLLKILSFIFIPLVFSMFIALLFLPLMRWFNKKNLPKTISISIIFLIIAGVLKVGIELIQLSSREILSAENDFFQQAESKIISMIISVEELFGVQFLQGENLLGDILEKDSSFKNVGSILGFVKNTVSMTLMTAFFAILWLAESINFQKLLNSTILRKEFASVKAFMKIEKDLITFIKVKFIVSLFTGIGISLACVFFGVSFPIFWGLFAFVINFVQMIGSFVSVILLAIFAFVEMDASSTLFFFILSITGVQALFGGVLEPVFMGKSFSINIITILVMLMLWGYIWGVPGLIMSIPLTVFFKIILEQFPRTRVIADLISGPKKKPPRLPKRLRQVGKKTYLTVDKENTNTTF